MIWQHLCGHNKERGKDGRSERQRIETEKENKKRISLTITSDVFEELISL